MRLGQQAGKALRTRATNRPLSVCQACQQSRFFAVRSALRSTSQEAAATAAAAGNEASSSAQALLKTWDSLYPDNVRWKARLTEAMENREPGSPAKRFTRIAGAAFLSPGGRCIAFKTAVESEVFVLPATLLSSRYAFEWQRSARVGLGSRSSSSGLLGCGAMGTSTSTVRLTVRSTAATQVCVLLLAF